MSGVTFMVSCLLATALAAPNTKIVGGLTAKDGQFPYQVSLRYDDTHNCGGSILNEKIILTAAHCVQGLTTSKMSVVTGTNTLDKGGDSYEVIGYDIHEEYNPFKIHHDIAVIRLRKPITFGPKVKAVQLHMSDIRGDQKCTLSGWGFTSYPTISKPNDLQYLVMRTIDLETCKETQKTHELISSQVCTQSPSGEGSCQGDSGGPLVDSDGEQIGIVSWGTPCAKGKPDVFTKIYDHLDWIKRYHKF